MKRIIFTGKGGVGKTTILSTLARLMSKDGYKILVVDCDPSMNLAMSLGVPISQVVALAEDKSRLQKAFGESVDNHHESGGMEIDQTLKDHMIDAADGVKLVVMGTISHGGSGCLCSPISLIKQLVNHIPNSSENFDFLMVDSQAGVEILGRGLSSDFDLSLVITEPTPKSIEVAKHSMRLSRDLDVRRQIVIVNMSEDEQECQVIAKALDLNGDSIDSVRYDNYVVEADKRGVHILDLAPDGKAVEDILRIKRQVVEA